MLENPVATEKRPQARLLLSGIFINFDIAAFKDANKK
jgi:hypothetical protein